MAAAKVIEMFLRRPTMAAAYPLTTRRVIASMLSPVVWVGARSTPASAAIMKPSTQPYWLIRLGDTPDIDNRSGSSTTARSAKPVRVE